MDRVKKASGWWVVLVAAVGLSLPAAAAAPKRDKDPELCRIDCQGKANAAVSTCAQACSASKAAGKEDEALQCMKRCSDKFQASQASCDKTCPAPKKAPEQVH